ncbi:MAG: hypothetical protein ACRC14_18000 [Paracoccaceae bacterium]
MLALGILGQPLAAQSLSEITQGIEAQIAADDFAGAMTGTRDLSAQVWEMTPFIGFTDSLLVTEPASGYGIYNPRPTATYKLGESILVYAEPYGYGFGSPGEGLHSVGFYVDLQVMNADGSMLGEVPNVVELDLTSRVRTREFQATITYDLSGVTPGGYVLVTTLRDKNSSKIGSFETAIEIVE